MSGMASPERTLSHASLQQAANWYVLLHDDAPSAQLRAQWQAWLDQQPEHRDAWRYVERVGQRFAPLQAGGERELASRMLRDDPRRISRRQSLKTLLVVGAGSLLGWGTWRTTPLPRLVAGWSADFVTGTGETRETRLADGSHLWLRAQSAVDAAFDTEQRLLRLRFGEVLIDTAKDATRPFLLENQHGRLRALGTRFGVRQDDGITRLSVYQGAVEVRTADSGQLSVIEAGQRVDFDGLSLGTPAPVQLAGESWTRQVLVADDMPLGELITALARYRHGHLGCHPAVAQLPVMGAFPLGDTEQALELLSAALPIRVQRLTDWWLSVEPA